MSIIGFDIDNLRQAFRVNFDDEANTNWLEILADGSTLFGSHWSVYVLDQNTSLFDSPGQLTPTPFCADLACAHRTANVCAFAETMLGAGWREPRQGNRIFVADMNTMSTITEQQIPPGIMDICWSTDGARLYALSFEGELWTCTFPPDLLTNLMQLS
jgi:hypothetical protein